MAQKQSATPRGNTQTAAHNGGSQAAEEIQANVLATLTQEHAQTEELMDQILATKEQFDGSAQRMVLFEQFRRDLLEHAQGEEQHFYPRLLQHPDTQSMARDFLNKHKEMEELVQQLTRLEANDPVWMDTFETLYDNVVEHVEEEEQGLFPLVAGALLPNELQTMDRLHRQQKKS